MPAERSQQVERLYHEARECGPDQRAAFLEQACAGDSAMRREVESLLAEDSGVRSFLETNALEFVQKMSRKDISQSLVGRQLGSYSILSFLAKGGMGEVYRARDTRLKREVAIKILPEEFSRDRDRIARFQREAEVLASLNHPNIAAIYELEETEGTRYLVLEFVEGETLAERIERGPIPIEQALNIARSICEALEAAHDKAITHRDLKPANIKLTSDGKVKVLDFGLAKLVANEPSAPNAPTLSMGATGSRIILGTAGYMSPEQAQGQPVDRRTDIFAFGCVLYEMLTGRPAFEGKHITEILGRVVTAEPDWSRLPERTPWLIQRLLRRALRKDAGQRLGDIRDARIEIEESGTPLPLGAASGLTAAAPTLEASPYRARASRLEASRDGARASRLEASRDGAHASRLEASRDGAHASRVRRARAAWFAAVLAVAIVGLLAIPTVLYFRQAPAPEIRVEISTPSTTDPLSFAISPDGRRLVFVASNEGRSQLWVRPLDSVAAKPLAGTDGAHYPFWSPDSASIGFFADGKLKRIDIVGGAPQVLANAINGLGGAWNRDGTIVFAPAAPGPLLSVPATSGEPVAITRLETGQLNHRFPQFLPDGRHLIYFVRSGTARGIYAASLNGGSSKQLVNADVAAVVSPAGFLLFLRQTTLFAQAFDFRRQELSGNPFPVAELAAFDANTNSVGVSATSGIVAYRTASEGLARQLAWLDRSGKNLGAIGAPDLAGLNDVELSPDGNRVAVNRTVDGNFDVWLIDVARGIPRRFTFDATPDLRPVWSPNGTRIVFQSPRKGVVNLYWKLSSGAGTDELLLESDQAKVANDWSSDGRFLLFRSTDPQTGNDLWVRPFFDDKKPFPFLKTQFDEHNGQFSPDGKWIAYQSDESGQFEVYVRPFPGPGGKFPISSNGGAQPRWNKNAKEIFYVSLDSKMMAAPVKLSPDGQSLETGTPIVLFPVRIAGGPLPPAAAKQQYAVSSDGQRFLVNLAVDQGAASPITLILNWHPKP